MTEDFLVMFIQSMIFYGYANILRLDTTYQGYCSTCNTIRKIDKQIQMIVVGEILYEYFILVLFSEQNFQTQSLGLTLWESREWLKALHII